MARKAKICVADDEPVLAEVIAEGLKAIGFDAVPAENGERAIEVCREQDIDLILLDVQMPGMDGYEVCQRLKQDPATKDIIVIFVTGRDEPEDHERGFDLGAVDYVTKPFNLPMLMVRVEAALRMSAPTPETLDAEDFVDTAYTDQLTGLRNQRYLLDRLQEEVEKAHRFDYPVSCVVLDLDGMQAVDPDAGAVEVDDMLAEVAMSLRNYTRSYDILARYDGTLFTALLPHTDLDSAMKYGEKILNDVESTVFSDPSHPTRATMSIGIVTFQNGSATAADFVFGEAMRSLLKAKTLPRSSRIFGRALDAVHD